MSRVRPNLASRELPQFVGYAQVAEAIGVSRRTVERMVRNGKFPTPVQLAPNRVGWNITVVRSWLDERGRGLSAVAVTDPDTLAHEEIAPAIRDLAARFISDQIGEAVSSEHVRLFIERRATSSDHALCRGHLLEQIEEICGHFAYWRALLVAASLFPSVRERLASECGAESACDPERLRQLAIISLDDEAWAEFEREAASQASE